VAVVGLGVLAVAAGAAVIVEAAGAAAGAAVIVVTVVTGLRGASLAGNLSQQEDRGRHVDRGADNGHSPLCWSGAPCFSENLAVVTRLS
jgi:hypothetical protein